MSLQDSLRLLRPERLKTEEEVCVGGAVVARSQTVRAPVSVPLLTLRHPYYPHLIRRWTRGQNCFDSWESKQLKAEALVPEDERLVNVHRDSLK
ncbi:unnamed protein product [Gadus morhua 'NCC']